VVPRAGGGWKKEEAPVGDRRRGFQSLLRRIFQVNQKECGGGGYENSKGGGGGDENRCFLKWSDTLLPLHILYSLPESRQGRGAGGKERGTLHRRTNRG